MKNIITAVPYFSGKNLSNMAWMSPANRAAMLKKYGLQSALSQVMPLVPQSAMNLFKPSNWAQALRNPPAQLFQRMAWAASVYDATQAEVAEHQSKPQPKKKRRVEDDALTAGALDENYNNPAAIEAQEQEAAADQGNIVEDVLETMEQSKTRMMAMGMANLNNLYRSSFANIQHELGIAEQDPMTPEQVDEWTRAHEGEPEHLGIRGLLLDQIAEHSEHFNLEQAQVADRFLDHMTAMLMQAGKGVEDLGKLSTNAIAKSFDQHVQSMSQAVSQMEQAAVSALKQQGAVPSAGMPTPQLSMQGQMNSQLAQMHAPALSPAPNMDPAHRMDQLRLAAIKLIYPNVPQPANALNQKIAPNPSQSAHESIKGELEHYAKEIGAGLSTMGKAADRFILQHLWPTSNPNHTATKELMQGNPLVATPEAHKSPMQKAMADMMSMKPKHQGQG